MDAALAEFAVHGFRDASLNRIIEASGISKGSMYYYFDGKEDLYADVIRRQLEGVFADLGSIPVPDTDDPDEFWATLEDAYRALMQALTTSPTAAALLRDWLSGAGAPRLAGAQHDAEQAVMPWLTETLAAGQRIGAIRTDQPADLLLGVVSAMGQAMDTWLITSGADADAAVPALMDMLRRAIGP